MERLFRSRMEYVTGPGDEGCFLCRALEADDDAANLVLTRRERTVVILNRYPYNSGHVMVAPKRHVADLGALGEEEQRELMQMLAEACRVLVEEMQPHGFNIGLNLGETAGAGLPGHLHFHIVPRWPGDTNFMPVVAGSKVIPETLEETYQRLAGRF